MALLFIDLDEFKAINDAHGHHVGDGVLRTVARRLVKVLRDGDFAGRLGGDEFVVIAEPVDTIDDAVDLARRVMATLTDPVTVAGATVTPTLSIGIGLSAGTQLTADEMLRDADLAVYRAKELGHDHIQVCNEDLRAQVLERESLEQAIRLAIDRDEFSLHFQPTIDTRTGALTSLEALLRWSDDDGEPIPPATFVPIAERSDLIIEIDRWVLGATARQLAQWTTNPLLHDVPIAVNISGRHLTGGTLVEDVTAALGRAELDPQRLMIEITETALLDDLDLAARDLAALRRLGVRIALDDFGTGYMSLATLRTLPVDVLKIDHTFVSNMAVDTEHSLIELIINTGHLLGMTVTAEGVETAEQQRLLAALGSDHLQGFLFSRPLTVDALQRLVADGLHGRAAAPQTDRSAR